MMKTVQDRSNRLSTNQLWGEVRSELWVSEKGKCLKIGYKWHKIYIFKRVFKTCYVFVEKIFNVSWKNLV